jgi:putative secretion ATPase (PEP-CTERM system associated)
MYAEFYRFTALPFQLTPDARFFYQSTVHARAMAHLTYGMSQGEGFIIITGDIGAGKTTLVEHLLAQVDPAQFIAGKIANTQLGADDMLRMVASAFGVNQESADKATVLRRLEAFLTRTNETGRRALLVVDECQNLSVPAVEELRMLSNLQVGGRPALQSFLLGQPQFRDILGSPDLDQLRQRVIASYHLGPLDAQETRHYIEHRLKRVGWDNDPALSDDFFGSVYTHTGGVPRRINTLVSRLLLFGFLEEKHELSGANVDEVARDLEHELNEVTQPSQIGSGGSLRPATPPTGANGAATAEGLRELASRIEVIEGYVRAHDRTIKRALQIAAEYLDGAKP